MDYDGLGGDRGWTVDVLAWLGCVKMLGTLACFRIMPREERQERRVFMHWHRAPVPLPPQCVSDYLCGAAA